MSSEIATGAGGESGAALAPTRVGPYELLEKLGEGGMAEVFHARERGSLGVERSVAIKRIRPRLARDQHFVKMLVDEARIAARIGHPNVAQLIGVGEDPEAPYLVLEFLRGKPLSRVIAAFNKRGAAPPVEIMGRIVALAAEGVHAAHETRDEVGRPFGIVHRDLSPHNLFVTFDGAVKVLDFGIAKARGRLTESEPGVVKGKLAYMSPEQLCGEAIERRSDVYSLGLVLYEATTGIRVFEGSVEERAANLVESRVQPPSRHRPGYPARLEGIVMRSLALKQADRFPTARALGRELDRFLSEVRALTGPAEISTMMASLFPFEAPATPTTSTLTYRSADATRSATMPRRRSRATSSLLRLLATALGAALVVSVGWHVVPGPSRAPAVPADPDRRTENRTAGPPSPPPVASGSVMTRPRPLGAAEGSPPAAANERAPEPVAPVAAAADAPQAAQEPRDGRSYSATAASRPHRSATAATGLLDVHSQPWAYVSLDGRRLQPTPLVGLRVPAGRHNVTLVTGSGERKRFTVVISPDRPTRLRVTF